MNTETILSVLVGLGLSAACGFRVFVPLLLMSLAARSGHLTLASGFEWIGTSPALLAFAVATVLEITGYCVPWLDHMLDVIAAPAAVAAGIVAMASSITGMSPFLHWTVAIIAGGGLSGTLQAFTGAARLTSTATTLGLGNPVVSAVEAGGSIMLSLLSITLPLVAAALVATILALIFWPGRNLLLKVRSL